MVVQNEGRRDECLCAAQGFTKKYGTDYDEVFAPVAKQVTFRTLLTVANQRKAVIKHFNVKTAYLNGELEETIFERPESRRDTLPATTFRVSFEEEPVRIEAVRSRAEPEGGF